MADIDQARKLIAGAERVVVLTGAGVSAESGVPTFRGAGGLWKQYRAEDLATPQAFARDPRLVWEWYGWRRGIVGQCRPNAAHIALAELATRRSGVRIVTQNVDGLHTLAARQAGAGEQSNAMPLELHGSLFRVRCTDYDHRTAHDAPIDAASIDTLPRCSRCGALLRPDVVWFGEALDEAILSSAFELAGAADVCLVVGTSAVVQPAASLALVTAARGGAIIEVNPEPTPLTPRATVSLRSAAAVVVPELVRG